MNEKTKTQIRKQFTAEVEKIGIGKAIELTGLSNNFILKVMAGRFFVSPRTLLTVRGVK